MDIVTFFEDLIELWNTEKKCDSCWAFSAPLSEDGMNATVKSDIDKCCTHFFITEYETSSGDTENPDTGEIIKSWCDHIFTLYVVKHASLGVNTYNEQPEHPISESLWATILRPIQNCLGCGKQFDLCELGYDFKIPKWNMKAIKLKEDHNYTGWRILGIFRQYTD